MPPPLSRPPASRGRVPETGQFWCNCYLCNGVLRPVPRSIYFHHSKRLRQFEDLQQQHRLGQASALPAPANGQQRRSSSPAVPMPSPERGDDNNDSFNDIDIPPEILGVLGSLSQQVEANEPIRQSSPPPAGSEQNDESDDDEPLDIPPTHVGDLRLGQEFIDMLKNASLDDSGLAKDIINRASASALKRSTFNVTLGSYQSGIQHLETS